MSPLSARAPGPAPVRSTPPRCAARPRRRPAWRTSTFGCFDMRMRWRASSAEATRRSTALTTAPASASSSIRRSSETATLPDPSGATDARALSTCSVASAASATWCASVSVATNIGSRASLLRSEISDWDRVQEPTTARTATRMATPAAAEAATCPSIVVFRVADSSTRSARPAENCAPVQRKPRKTPATAITMSARINVESRPHQFISPLQMPRACVDCHQWNAIGGRIVERLRDMRQQPQPSPDVR